MKIHIGYGLWIVACYIPAYVLHYACDVNGFYIMIGLWLLGYPVFYFTQAASGVLATLPVDNTKKSSLLVYLYCFKGCKRLYSFYGMRIAIELVLSGLLPFLLSNLNIMKFMIPWLVLCGLCLPFALFRSVSYEVKVKMFMADPEVAILFRQAFT